LNRSDQNKLNIEDQKHKSHSNKKFLDATNSYESGKITKKMEFISKSLKDLHTKYSDATETQSSPRFQSNKQNLDFNFDSKVLKVQKVSPELDLNLKEFVDHKKNNSYEKDIRNIFLENTDLVD